MFRERFMFPGSSCAAVLAAGIASFFIGLITILLVIDQGMGTNADWVTFEEFSSLIVLLAVIVWFAGWYYLRFAWKNAAIKRKQAYKISGLLTVLGIAGTLFSATKFLLQMP
jgi:hypothetical protein